MANPEILELLSTNKVFDGELRKYKFKACLNANFNLFLPSHSAAAHVPLLVYLAGLTCTEDNGAQKGGFFGPAAAKGIALLFPDTSPRGAGVEGEDKDWDFGVGAGFYLNATNPAFAKHYNMLTHVTLELPQVLSTAGLPIVCGHGALTLYLASKTNQYRSVSAFSPICNPINCPWGQKAFKGYLQGGTTEAAEQYDATELIKKRTDPVRILIDYGTADNFYKQGQLLPENFVKAAREAGHDESQVQVRSQDGYDHSYFFISTFATDHINFHAEFLL
ncbi:carbohydrate esterase family 1 protein [Mycena metata]|uniref:S-formylglutathione hydrolase n=1 Tax=Mycena metata TaxID=1033252 RepID=A0AAD7KJ92_9AGAR|nr:carbohydrate esterase family 1 protein [Mycena metata]